jgi:tetratricopeptide (TPR) repeat protein
MKGLLIISVAFLLLAVGCKSDPKTEATKNIEKLEEQLYADQILDREKGIELINAYVAYSKDYAEDTSSAMYLFKAGEIGMNLQIGQQAISYFKKATEIRKDFEKEPECIFLAAFIYENQLGKLAEAEKLYKLFIKKYPNHALANDAKASLQYLGKTPEELIKMFQEKNKE